MHEMFVSATIIKHNRKYFISVKELALSMKPRQELKNTVVEVAIQTINHNQQKNSKKFVMPLRIGVSTKHIFSLYSLFTPLSRPLLS